MVWHGGIYQDTYARVLFPQAGLLGPTAFETYGNNGLATFTITPERASGGPDGFAQLRLQTYGDSIKENAGWVISLPKGLDLSQFKGWRFWIKGETGREQIDVKAKDGHGHEIPVTLERYLRHGTIETGWQHVSIPFDHFGPPEAIDFGFMANFSLFITGETAKREEQVVYVGGFEWW